MTAKVTNIYNLKLTPSQFGQNSIVVNCSQYDSLFRIIQFNLFNGNAVYSIPEGSVVTIRGTKKDNTGFEYECDFYNNVVTFPLQQQITIFPGKVPAELRIVNDGEIIGSWNFLFLVEESPLSDETIISETDLPLLQSALQAAAEAENYKNLAQQSADNASESEQNASESEANALTYSQNAQTSANSASQSEANALTYSQNASESATEAQGFAQDAEDSATQAQGYATSASQSATTAQQIADEIADLVDEAQGYASQSLTNAQNSAQSASQAQGYANSASQSSTDAQTYANNASASATIASTKANEASSSATVASNKASEASGYATTASQKASEASTSETNASNSASSASTSSINANTSALKAEGYAVGKQNDVDVSSGTYYQNNAKYYAEKTEVMYTNVADSYDSASTYNLGDRVIYNGVLYKCISAITTAEAWNASHWQVCKVFEYDDLLNIIRIVDDTTTMGDITAILNQVNSVGDHVIFDVAGLNAGMYLCTIYIGSGYYRIADLVTGFEGTGFFSATDLLKDIISSGSQSTGKHYTVQWDKTNAQCTRLNDAASITTVTTNFKHSGSVNENYDNPFDSIYPWSERKLCNIDLETYMGLTETDDITDCVTAWEDDDNFSYDDQYGVWVYTPPFFGRTYELGNYRYFDVTDENLQNNIEYPAMINGRWFGADVTLTIDGASKHCNLPLKGMNMANVSLANQHTYARNYKGTLVDIYKLDASSLLYIVEFANMNSQNTIGNGVSDLYQQTLKLASDVSNSNTITLTATNAKAIVGAIIDIGTTDGDNNIAKTYITAVNGATLTLADAVTATTAHFVSIHGLINLEDSDIGSKSGYIGTNGRCNAYYRGEVLWGNKWQYILGAYRQTGTQELWIADKDDTDNYDALNTSVHIDTGCSLPTISAANWYYENDLHIVDGLSAPPFISEINGNSSNPIGDGSYIPLPSVGNTICLSGGFAIIGAYGGLFCVSWNPSSGSSYWAYGSRPSLMNP